MGDRIDSHTGNFPRVGADVRGSGATEVFFATDGADERPVLLFQHIQKTAGSSLRQIIAANLPPHERAAGKARKQIGRSREELLAWYEGYYDSLAEADRDRICCVMAHSANYLLPALDRPVVPVAVIRDPLDRVLSQYYWAKFNRDKPLAVTGEAIPQLYKSREQAATLLDIYDQVGGSSPAASEAAAWNSRFFNGQSRSLLGPFHDVSELGFDEGPPADADLWRERLAEVVESYTIGVQERFDDLVAALAQRFGWGSDGLGLRKASKSNPSRPRQSDLDAEWRERLRAFNWLDRELYEPFA